jgi:polyphosphate kinase 2 (PPK2 family)
VLLIKCFLHISPGVQEKRLLARLDNPIKTWKYDAEDVTERAHWDSYQHAYNDALTACRGPDARWWIIPSDRKWYRNWAVAALLTQQLQDLDPRYPPPPKNIQSRADTDHRDPGGHPQHHRRPTVRVTSPM